MDRQEFWRLIDWSGAKAADCWEQSEILAEKLARLPPAEIVSFQHHFDELMCLSYRADLWDVASIVHGGCSDTLFDFFRGWLIAQGQAVFQTVLNSPARIGDYVQRELQAMCRPMLSVASAAYESVTGERSIEPAISPGTVTLQGEHASDEELRVRYPDLWRRFVEDGNEEDGNEEDGNQPSLFPE